MEDSTKHWMSRTTAGTMIGTVMILEVSTFGIGALLHLGTPVPLGFAVITEPQIIPATIVEGLCGLVLAVGAYAVFTGRNWAWSSSIAAHIFSIAGVLLGITALALGLGPRTTLNNVYHWTILTVLILVLLWLLTSRGKTALGRGRLTSGRE